MPSEDLDLSQFSPEEGEPVIEPEVQEPSPVDEYQLSEHAQNFAMGQEIPEEFKPQFETILKQWDAGFTRKMQEVQGQLGGYSEYGTPEEIGEAFKTIQNIRENPQAFYQALHEQFGQPDPTPQPSFQVPEAMEDLAPVVTQLQQTYETQLGQLRQGYDQQLNQQAQAIDALNKQLQSMNQSTQEEQRSLQLQQQLQLVQIERPDVDINFVKEKLGTNGGSIDAALADWESAKRAVAATMAGNTQSPVLPSGGNPPAHNDVDVSQLNREDTVSLVAQLLEASKNEGR